MADAAHGIQFKRGDGGAPEAFTAIANIEDITPPAPTRDTIEVSSHSSTDKWREYIGGLRDGGELGLVLVYEADSSSQNALRDDLETDAARNYQIVFNDGGATVWQFSGLVTGFEVAAPRDSKYTANVTIKVSGKPDFDA
jgi:predicted secreted protein